RSVRWSRNATGCQAASLCLKAASTICPTQSKKQAAATVAVLAAKENPPAPSPKTQAASASVIADKEATTSIPPNPLPKGDFAPSVVPMPRARIANASAVENDQPTQSKQSSASTWAAERR